MFKWFRTNTPIRSDRLVAKCRPAIRESQKVSPCHRGPKPPLLQGLVLAGPSTAAGRNTNESKQQRSAWRSDNYKNQNKDRQEQTQQKTPEEQFMVVSDQRTWELRLEIVEGVGSLVVGDVRCGGAERSGPRASSAIGGIQSVS